MEKIGSKTFASPDLYKNDRPDFTRFRPPDENVDNFAGSSTTRSLDPSTPRQARDAAGSGRTDKGSSKFPWLPVLTVPLLFAGPKGWIAYAAVNTAGCGPAPEGNGDEHLSDGGNGSMSGNADAGIYVPGVGTPCYWSGDCRPEKTHMVCVDGICTYLNDGGADGGVNGGFDGGVQDAGYRIDAGIVEPDAGMPQPECASGASRACGPCDLGIEFCGEDQQWSGNCEGAAAAVQAERRACYTGSAITRGVGECKDGAQKCAYNAVSGTWGWGACEGQVLSRAEACDGKDNDCDNLTDEGPNNEPVWTEEFYTGQPSSTKNRLPCRPGKKACNNGGWETVTPEVTPQPEVCDGADNNCNGSTDEGLLNACGICGPVPVEVCNGIDDNCNGRIDEAPACTEFDCVVTDTFYFGNDFSSHCYAASPGVRRGVSPQDSCGASLGIYFQNIGDWVQIRMAVSNTADRIVLSTWSNTGGLTVQADGYACSDGYGCWTGEHCNKDTMDWNVRDLSHNIIADGAIEFVFKAQVLRVGATDIAKAEVESCTYHYR